MLARTQQNYRNSGWPVLTAGQQRVDPFDLQLLDGQLQPTGAEYQQVDGDEDFLDNLHKELVGQAHSDDIIESEVGGIADDAKLAVFQMAPAVPVATVTQAAAGTTGVSPCVAVLVKGDRNQQHGYGCIHLSAVDMETYQGTVDALDRLWTEFTAKLGGAPTAAGALFAVGGAEDENVEWAEFARVVGACRALAAAKAITFVGVVIPVNGQEGSVEVYVNEDGVAYEKEGEEDSV
jgi:hypothetical protein